MISVETLRAQVRNTVPFLFPAAPPAPIRDGDEDKHEDVDPDSEDASSVPATAPAAAPAEDTQSPAALTALASDPRGFVAIVRSEALVTGEAYFALCCASHHATVASYVPTDVDSKIRGALWRSALAPALRASRIAFVLQARHWSTAGISARVVGSGAEAVSGHNGEWLSVLLAALGHCVVAQDAAHVEVLSAAVEQEIWREARLFAALRLSAGAETVCQGLAAILTHNAGDLDQAISYWPNHAALQPYRLRFARLAHDNASAFEGVFQHAARIYKATLAPEGHRNYPLRAVKALRAHPELLLPLSPFLDRWGGVIATHPSLTETDRLEVVSALLDGCEKIPGQRGYYRALSGLRERWPGTAAKLLRRLSPGQRRGFEQLEMQRQLAVPQAAFEEQMRKRYLAARDG